jgi:hypothetical protein
MAILFPISAFADSRLNNCLPYKEEIFSILESEGVSSDYFYLAVCESGCKIKTSSKGARGFFQFIPYTFSVYKDDSCTDIDDIKCNTIAAARYIKHLQKRFKEISILVKAYNRGGTNLLRKGSTREADGLSYCVMKHLSNEKNN